MSFELRLAVIAISFMILSGCQEGEQAGEVEKAAADLMWPLKGENIADNILPLSGSRRCDFTNRMVCSGGTACKPLKSDVKVYTVIDFDKKSYSRCTSVDGCLRHDIDYIGGGNPINNLSVSKPGVLVKYGPGNRFVDIATQGAKTFLADGICTKQF
jgi:hypothetical protein